MNESFLLVVPALAVLSAPTITEYQPSNLPKPAFALLGGAIVGLVSYGLLYALEDNPVEKAVLLGLLVAESLLFGVHSLTSAALLLFLYLNGVSHLKQHAE